MPALRSKTSHLARARHLAQLVERVILPDSTILADYLLARMTDIVAGGMRVFPERMLRNSGRDRPACFSGQLCARSGEAGAAREARVQVGDKTCDGGMETETTSARVGRRSRELQNS